jgi:DNA repair ATPase RecN
MTTEERFEKIANAIRDLIVVSRTLLESQKATNTQIDRLTQNQQKLRDDFDQRIAELNEMDRKLGIKLDALAERSAETEEKLHALIDIVDQIIRKRNGQS